MTKMTDKLYGFWRYGRRLLGGLITSFDEKGAIETVEFGRGHRFRPVLVLPEAPGKQFLAELKRLEAKQEMEQQQISNRHDEEFSLLLAAYGVSREK